MRLRRLLWAAVVATPILGGAAGIIPGSVRRTGERIDAERLVARGAVLSQANSRLAAAGPHEAGWQRVTVRRAGGGTFTAILYYPAQTRGEEAAYDPTAAPYAGIAFGHGFLQTPQRYSGTLEHLATWGYFVLAPESHTGLAPSHQGLADDLLLSLAWLAEQNADPDSQLRGQVDITHRGLLGHSMGGGASLLALEADRVLTAVATLAAADTVPSAGGGLAGAQAPLAFLVGSEDRLVPPARTEALYRSAGPPKQLATILGGSHCGFQDDPFPIACDEGSLPRPEQLAIIRARLAAFFGLYLKGERSLDALVWGPPADERVRLLAERGTAAVLGAYLPFGLVGRWSTPGGRPALRLSGAPLQNWRPTD